MKKLKLIPESVKKYTGEFLKGIWKGMGTPQKRTIKTPKGKPTVPKEDIRKAVRKHPPKR